MTSPKPEPMTEEELRESAGEILRLSDNPRAFCAPWVSRTFEIDCPCPNGVHCGDPHSCEEVVSPEEYPASHEEPAEMTDDDPGQCVVQISIPGLETFTKANGELIAGLRNRAPAVVRGLLELLDAERAKRVEAEAKLNTPELHDFAKAVVLEAAHQRERWGAAHDAGKTPADWFWLIGYLAGKALHRATQGEGDPDKCLHHIITTAAACANWHAAIMGTDNRMRPGIDPVERGVENTEGEATR